MRKNSITFDFEARYFQLGEINESTKNLIFVLHGYGQQAQFFIRNFKVLENPENCIIAPEGLSRFYLKGFEGRVGATWMTREDRLTDIRNYIRYLNAIHQHLNISKIKTSIVGFSQGAATACRWAVDDYIKVHKLVLWSGVFPPDMDLQRAKVTLANKPVYFVYGDQDPFITEDRLSEMKALTEKLKITPSVLTFNGKHELHPGTLEKIFL